MNRRWLVVDHYMSPVATFYTRWTARRFLQRMKIANPRRTRAWKVEKR